jgi:uroporphyrinogen III methyltransferase/synthase
MPPALVSFVSLGPGEGALCTARATRRLDEADIVLRDADGAAPERVIDLARAGKRVVRAVAGEAFESPDAVALAREVARAGIPIEVVPGIGARSAAAAFAGVLGRAVRVPTDGIAAAVAGEPPEAAVTLIAGAGTPSQRVVTSVAREAPERARALGADAVIVAFGLPDETLRWFERRPLFGKRVLVTRAREQAGGTVALLREYGAEPVVVPTIEIHPPTDRQPLERALRDLRAGRYAWVAFTSANGVERTWEALSAGGGDARAFGAARLAAIGPATAKALEGHGLRPDVVAKEFRGEGLAVEMIVALRASSAAGPPRVLLARAARARDALPAALRGAGCEVDIVAAYETRPPSPDVLAGLVRELQHESRAIDAVTFTSSSTVEHLCDWLGAHEGGAAGLLAGVRVACIGPVTADTARSRGLRVDLTAAEYTVSGLVQALAESWG